jgi:hypothetical protein
MLIGAREHEFRGVEPGRLGRVDIDHGERYAPLSGRCDELSHLDLRVKHNSVYSGPIASYTERPSESHTCGVRQPGTVEGVNADIEKAGWAAPS